jgi:cytoplasmic tRNA 2-thiolation protein 1
MACENCRASKAIIVRPKDKMRVCKECFFELFENEIHDLIVSTNMFEKCRRVGVGISGGKDSTVLAYILDRLNKKYGYGIEMVLLCVDEGIEGYRDRSIETVRENQKRLGLELSIVSYKEMFGMTMDEVAGRIGRKGNCTYCGVFRRQALEVAARNMNVDCIVTGHNADDVAETVLLNFIRGDISRLRRCTMSRTREHPTSGNSSTKHLSLSRCKPFKHSYQKEIVFYAYFKKLPYFSTECTYAPGASRGDTRALIKDLERVDSKVILKIIRSGELFGEKELEDLEVKQCKQCGHPTSSPSQICIACGMVEKLGKMSFDCHCRDA